MVFVALLLIAFWMLAGSLVAGVVAASRGYDDTHWAILGLLIGPLAVVALLSLPQLEPPSFLVHGRVNTELMECPTCRHVVPRRNECGSCGDVVPLVEDDWAAEREPAEDGREGAALPEPSAAVADRRSR